MRRILTRALCAVTLAGLSCVAFAAPIYFNFEGTVSSVSAPSFPDPILDRIGQSFTGGFTIETDRLFASPPGANPLSQNYTDFSNPGPTASSTHLNIGGVEIPFPQQQFQYTGIAFNDACSPAPPTCTPQWAEDFLLFGFTSDAPFNTAGVTGQFSTTSLSFISSVPMVPIDPADPYGGSRPAFDYFDLLAGSDPTDILTLPLYDLFGTLSESQFSCTDGVCQSGPSYQTSFSITSVSRGYASVPEPGTLGLFGAAGLGFLLLGRRRCPLK